MRVIAGTYRSRPLTAPRGMATRPTSDRLRETLFNVLAPRIQGARFADLYAGSGAVGIEALSRGAGHVYFAEKASTALDAIRGNLNALGIRHGFTVEARGAGSLLTGLARSAKEKPVAGKSGGSGLDVVFLDPPWEDAAEYTATLGLLGGRVGKDLLTSGAVVVAEHASRTPLPSAFGALRESRTLKQGDAALTFYKVENSEDRFDGPAGAAGHEE